MRFAVILLAFAATADAQSPPPTSLRAVRFADAREGWAAGDHGLIVHTIDGGRTWERQPTGSRASLTGLAFPSPYVGYAVGRAELPTGGSSGTVLRTDDAGVTWHECNGTGLPGLNCVQFFDETRGFAAGDSTASYPASVYFTNDAGRTWHPVPGLRVGSVNAMTCPDATTGIFASDRGPLMLRNGRLDPLPTHAEPSATTACAQLGDKTTVIATANGKLLRHDGDWNSINLAPCGSVRSISTFGPTTVAVGRIGIAFRSDDRFQTHTTATLPTPVPLNAVQMIDAQNGCAVGELGTILTTNDAGKTWQLRRAGGQRAAFLFAHADAKTLPTPLIAKLAQIEGYHCVATLTEAGDPTRLAAAMAYLGAAGADCSDPTAIPHFMRLSPPNAASEPERLERLVVALKTWRPEVVVTDPAGETALAKAAFERMQKAIPAAADPAAYPQHAALGLTPYRVVKLVTLDPAGTTTIDCAGFVPELGESYCDYAEPASALLPGSPRPPRTIKITTISGTTGDLTAGVALAPGGTARRELVALTPDAEWLHARRGWHDARRELETLASTNTPESRAAITSKLAELPAPILARAAVALAADALKRGDASRARDLYQLVADRAALETPAAIALDWLARRGASSELTRRTELGHFADPPAAFWEAVPTPDVQTAGTITPTLKYRLRDPETAQNYYLAATEWPARLAAFGPALTRDPFAHLAADAARRKLDRAGDAAANLRALLAADPCDFVGNPMKIRLAEEARLLTPGSADNPEAPMLNSVTARAPYLDGKLDEPAWQSAPTAILKHWTDAKSRETFITRVHATTDGKFLYLAVNAEGQGQDGNTTLDGQDRVEFLLDLDRDYSSYYRIRVAADGKSDCDCLSDTTWRSGHFAAATKTPRGWSAEIAIPLTSLTGADVWGEVWCFNATRVIPGVAAGGWAGPSDGKSDPAMMGHLRMPTKPKQK